MSVCWIPEQFYGVIFANVMLSLGFFIELILSAAQRPGFDPTNNRNEYQEYLLAGEGGRCIGLTSFPPS
jgi:hypothetical protein